MFQTIAQNETTKVWAAYDPNAPEIGEIFYCVELAAFVKAVRYHYTDAGVVATADRTVKKFALLATDDSAAILAGLSKRAVASDQAVITTDTTGGNAVGGDGKHIGMGTLLGTPTAALPVCYIQISGYPEFTAGSSSIVAGDFLIPDTTENGDMTENDGTAGDVYGQAQETVADDATGTFKLRNCM